jgi:outer membrane protein TolC
MNKSFLSRRLPVGFVATMLLSACHAGPDYRSLAETVAPFHNSVAPSAEPAPLDSWWTGFRDPALTRIVERALAQNLDLAASQARVRKARAVADETGARLLPSGDLQTQVAPLHQSIYSPSGEPIPEPTLTAPPSVASAPWAAVGKGGGAMPEPKLNWSPRAAT